MYDLIIIGGGPAGLTAAIYAIRKRLNCLLISPDLGGKANVRMIIEGGTTYQVINGADSCVAFRNEIEYLDFARVLEKVTQPGKARRAFLPSPLIAAVNLRPGPSSWRQAPTRFA